MNKNKNEPWLAAEVFRQAVAALPLVSIDLLVEDHLGRFLLGRRSNPPAQGSWFVPGGRIRKGERRLEALRRLLQEELGLAPDAVPAQELEFRGVYEHFYDINFAGEAGNPTHYVVLAYALRWPGGDAALPLAQHGAYRWLTAEQVLADDGVHAYVKAYFAEPGTSGQPG
ncbi:GDP-mannose mannosyl hydrolase [Cupriavidus sp. USMAHM13]|uniref:GDP-mannose mannosyl hydrolase n=1 Tax=Cupriavidus sp. USMAHM13 TaxID=1389192 RepID=UPI0008A6CB58|nr:GDP-mannose mannosyl hydrolase [Cupriavidus sp. USMAHM13]AOY98935.1 GDP-mannose mannosyl hydrolase [Cupriavidus sp. USMAHM13]